MIQRGTHAILCLVILSFIAVSVDSASSGEPLDSEIKLVDLRGVDLRYRDLWYLGQVPELVSINLSHCNLTNKEIGSIGRLSTLEVLRISGNDIGDGGLRIDAPHLKVLEIDYTHFDDRDATRLHRFPKLHTLAINNTRITSKSLAEIAKLANLHLLILDCNEIDDDALTDLISMTSLRALSLAETKIGDNAIPVLRQMGSLRHLDLSFTKVSARGQKQIANTIPQCTVSRLMVKPARITNSNVYLGPTANRETAWGQKGTSE